VPKNRIVVAEHDLEEVVKAFSAAAVEYIEAEHDLEALAAFGLGIDHFIDVLDNLSGSITLKLLRADLPRWIYDRDTTRFLEVNDVAVKTYGWTREEFLDMTIVDIRPPEDIPALMLDLSGSRHFHGPWRHTHKDGSVHQVIIQASTIRFEGRDCRSITVHPAGDLTLVEELEPAHSMTAG
jgi:PAS domain S-box-containing protein